MPAVTTTKADDLVRRGASIVKRYARTEVDTATLQDLAAVLIELRSCFTDPSGGTDWRGRTNEYRQAAARIYAAGKLSPEDLHRLQSAVRYHVGNLLRERLTPEELEHLGLDPTDYRQRMIDRRAEAQAAATALLGEQGDGSDSTPDQAERLLTAAIILIERVAKYGFDPAPDPEQYERIFALLLRLHASHEVIETLLAEP
jgi:hypothetical protein